MKAAAIAAQKAAAKAPDVQKTVVPPTYVDYAAVVKNDVAAPVAPLQAETDKQIANLLSKEATLAKMIKAMENDNDPASVEEREQPSI